MRNQHEATPNRVTGHYKRGEQSIMTADRPLCNLPVIGHIEVRVSTRVPLLRAANPERSPLGARSSRQRLRRSKAITAVLSCLDGFGRYTHENRPQLPATWHYARK